mmetsp:Transcript_56347/g.159937  ORF Transcript_56347/g.159937 Transcript_56347/m.159937 type:complete len:1764 (-) Transcript_56347:90-5381(-)
MGDEPHHECGFALLRLLKPLEYYEEKYGTNFFGLNRMYLMMEKQRNRGQDGCGVANVKLDVPPGTRYISCEKSIVTDPIKDVFERVQRMGGEKLQRAPREAREAEETNGKEKGRIDPTWIKENVPFAGELFLAHVRYGTDSDNSIDRCHPVLRESNWMTRSLLLAGNFNITNNEDLFSSLVQIGQHPRELSDTVTLLEKIGHFVDKENNDLYVKYSATGQAPRTCFSLIAENINVARILRRASVDWDGGYCIAGLFGHGDAFCLRDPCGIRPAFYLATDEVVVVASEAPLIQTVFLASEEQVKPLPPGQALVIKRSGRWSLERVLPAQPLMQCSFERIYFSRGNDAGVYRERNDLGRRLLQPLVKMLEAKGDNLANTVLSFIPNTSELAFNGLVKEAHDEMARKRAEVITQLMQQHQGCDLEEALRKVAALGVRAEKVVHKDAKIRTFIQEDSSREHLTVHAYDVHYGTVKSGEDVLVALDDSIVRGNTLKNAILGTLDRLGPKRILVLSSAPQIRFPDVYGIDMAKMGDLAAFKGAVTLLQESGRSHILTEVYRDCRAVLAQPLGSGEFVNHVKRIYEAFTPEEISAKIVEQVTPPGCKAEVEVLFNTVEALHQAMPEHKGDWYFTGNYPTNGGTKVCCRAFVLWMEGSSARCYGVSSASSCARTPVLVVGHGGSEHALAWKLSQSHEVGCVYVAPGNGGTLGQQAFSSGSTDGGSGKDSAPLIPVDVPLTPPLFKEVKDFCKERSVALAVIGSEQLLAEGLADVLRAGGVPVFGPSQAASEIEASRSFSRAFAQRRGVATAEPPVDEAALEEWPKGAEVSVLAVSDGVRFSVIPAAVQDQKRTMHQDRGPATDGMGAFAPSPLVDVEVMKRIEQEVLRPVLEGLRDEERPFVGCLHAELVLMPSGPKVLALRCRMGDPAAQALLPLLDCDLFEVFSACAGGRLGGVPLLVRPEASCVAVVVASGGYPGTFRRGFAISGLERALCVPGAHIFHSGTAAEDAQNNAESPKNSRNGGSKLPPTRMRSFSNGVMPPSMAQRMVTCGGRVLTVAAVGRGLNEARERAYVGVRAISFTDAWYRHDIAALATLTTQSAGQSFQPPPRVEDANQAASQEFTYRSAGVDNAAREAAIASFAPLMRMTRKSSAMGETEADGVLQAGAAKALSIASSVGFTKPVLISSTATVGTKLKVASKLNRFDSIGIDLVAICANNIAARGAEPLFFHEHFSTEQLDAHQAMQLVKGVADGCVEAGCVLLDSGLAELPGVFMSGGCDFVGFAVGTAEASALLPHRDQMAAGDVLIALPASGLHSNGFSLVRLITRSAGLEYSQAAPFDPTHSLGEALLPPTRVYVKPVLALARAGLLRGAAQVASGGLDRCFDDVLPPHLAAHLRSDAWELPAVFRWLAAVGKIRSKELASTFNCGLGMVLVVAAENAERVMDLLHQEREEPVLVGELVARSPGSHVMEVEGAEGAWLMLPELGVSLPFPEVLSSLQDPWTVSRMRVMVLAGGEEVSPLQALLQATAVPASAASLVGVTSPNPGSPSLRLARAAGVKDFVLGDGKFTAQDFFCDGLDDLGAAEVDSGADESAGPGCRDLTAATDFSAQLQKAMESVQAELLVILDDVDPTLLTRSFLSSNMGRVVVLHASLLPSFPGVAPIEAALRSGVCITGCTVCFAVPPPTIGAGYYGPQVLQETLRIAAGDTAFTLRQRLVQECEAPALPRAVQLIASGSVVLRHDDAGYGLGRSASFSEAASEGMLASSPREAN